MSQAILAANMSTSLASLETAVDAVGTLEGASIVSLAPVLLAANATKAVFDAAVTELDGDVDGSSLGGVISSLPGPAIAATLLSQTSVVEQLSTALEGRALAHRIAANIAQAPG